MTTSTVDPRVPLKRLAPRLRSVKLVQNAIVDGTAPVNCPVVWRVKCGVWRVKCGVWRVKWDALYEVERGVVSLGGPG